MHIRTTGESGRAGTGRLARWVAGAAVALVGAALAALAPLSASPASAATVCSKVVAVRVDLALPATSTGSINCFMAYGDVSDAVAYLQRSINKCYLAPRGMTQLKVDKIYGHLTEAAVYFVQGVIHANQDGVYGPETRSKMRWPNNDTPNAPCVQGQ